VKPKRIQRKRTKGWKMPPNTVCVTRPGKYGNPFTVNPNRKPGSFVNGQGYINVPSSNEALACFREYVELKLKDDPKWLDELRGKDLACWCGLNKSCHADILLTMANAVEGNQ